MKSISRVRARTKYECVKICIEKEKRGYECISPITKKYWYQKQFKRDGKFFEFQGVDDETYYEAIYERVTP